MEIKEFIENFAGELDETALEDLTPETEFKALGEWSSLVALSIIAMIDDNYDKEVTGDDLRNCKTLQDLCNLVENK